MITVKIKRDSIRKNPRAGSSRTSVSGHATFTFKLEGVNASLPRGVTESDVLITSKSFNFDNTETIEGVIINQTKVILFMGAGQTTVHRDIVTFNHFPEAEYFYEYENPIIKCNDCSAEVPFEEIEQDWRDCSIDRCPICDGSNTFDYKMESINEVKEYFKTQ